MFSPHHNLPRHFVLLLCFAPTAMESSDRFSIKPTVKPDQRDEVGIQEGIEEGETG